MRKVAAYGADVRETEIKRGAHVDSQPGQRMVVLTEL